MKNKILFLLMFLCGAAVKLDDATFKVGRRYFDQGLYTEAEKRFLDIVRKFPDSKHYRDSLFYLGQTYAHMNKFQAALQYYKVLLNKARTVKEKQSALLGIAKSWLQMGVHAKAAEFYSFYASEYPESEYTPAALYFAGIARERENNIKNAIEKYRLILEMYPNSDYYAKAIEKVAVLDSQTPEELFAIGNAKKISQPQTSLFAEDELTLENIPGYNPTALKSQQVSEGLLPPLQQHQALTPSVVTQVIVQQITPPAVVTQFVEVPQQTVVEDAISIKETISPANPPLQEVVDSSLVLLSNGMLIPAPTPEEEAEQAKIAEYRRQWEEELKIKERENNLKAAEGAVEEMLKITDNKAGILNAKEIDLAQKQSQIRSSVYKDLKNIENLRPTLPYQGKPIQTNTPAINTNTTIPGPASVIQNTETIDIEGVGNGLDADIDETAAAPSEYLDDYQNAIYTDESYEYSE